MRRRLPQVTAVLSATALLTLTGCVTVHGERAVVPAVTKAEAAKALERFTDGYNRANRELDPALGARVETGALQTMGEADLKARRVKNPDGLPDYPPLKLTDARFAIPRQAGWPKFFVADTDSNRDDNRWLLVFTRSALDDPWKAAYLSILSRDEVPEFAVDEDGYAEPVTGGRGSALLTDPAKISKTYTDYLGSGEGELFADGYATSAQLAYRKRESKTPKYWTQFADQPARPPQYRTVALRTEDGGALAFFAAHHTQKQTMAEGFTINKINDQKANALLTGKAEKSLTLVRISQSAVSIPPKGDAGKVVFLNRLEGLTAARGG
ncbi:hypothetical protein DMH02_016270 [Streptomyces sp. WAC 00631]|uniref:hypothetical protein n=1 Tax=unclassified Streptomyces TaxID=2593676 RepID=UPI001E44A15D|nr:MULTISPECIES: hypothetical protein [unclassified Streptomyces]MCC5034735.1 hypothetical protein [Streptomyces sp. WAC 00631]MCC9741899.1 hypothetical protein [Streptomyces sp. MNU89]